MFVSLTSGQWLTLHGFVTLAALLLYVVTSHAMPVRRSPAAAIAWVLFILMVPYVALPAYWVFGSRKRRRGAAVHLAPVATPAGWAIDTALALGQPPPADYADLHVHATGAQASAALMQTIDDATRSIDICTFILRRDVLGEAVLDRLCERARSGVRVRVLLDGMGRLMAGGPDMRRLIEAGGAWATFVPPLTSLLTGRSNLRNHRKLVVADAGLARARLWCGGRNLGAEYFQGHGGDAPWCDLSCDLRGALVAQAHAMFEHDWRFATREGPAQMAEPVSATEHSPSGAQLIASGPDQADDTLQAMLLSGAYQALHRIVLVSPYFVPDTALLSALSLAARRGVSIDLLVPRRSNHRLSDLARNRALRTLAQAGARVHLTDGMLHAKLVIIDEGLALAGSANLDTRSLFLNYEAMIAFHDPVDVQRFADWFEQQLVGSGLYVVRRPGPVRDIAEGMLLWMAFQL
jgi:cardiolipin synthase